MTWGLYRRTFEVATFCTRSSISPSEFSKKMPLLGTRFTDPLQSDKKHNPSWQEKEQRHTTKPRSKAKENCHMDAKKEDETRRKDHPSLVAGLPLSSLSKSSPFGSHPQSWSFFMDLYGNRFRKGLRRPGALGLAWRFFWWLRHV